MWENECRVSGGPCNGHDKLLATVPSTKNYPFLQSRPFTLNNWLSTQISWFFHSHGYLEQRDYPVPPDTWMGQKIKLGEHLLGSPLALQPSPRFWQLNQPSLYQKMPTLTFQQENQPDNKRLS